MNLNWAFTTNLWGRTLDLSFWSFFTFLHWRIEKVETYILWKFHTIRRKSWSIVPPKLLAYFRFLYKVVHKIGRLRKFNRARRLNLTFLPLGLSLWNLAHFTVPRNFRYRWPYTLDFGKKLTCACIGLLGRRGLKNNTFSKFPRIKTLRTKPNQNIHFAFACEENWIGIFSVSFDTHLYASCHTTACKTPAGADFDGRYFLDEVPKQKVPPDL